MYIVFEDDVMSPISNLLRSCFWGDKLVFASGVGNVTGVVDNLVKFKNADRITVYIDVVPDNIATMKAFVDIRDKIIEKHFDKDIKIIPIPCIEYYVLLLLIRRRYLSEKKLSEIGGIMDNGFNYRAVRNVSHSDAHSLEARYKDILANCGRCFKNEIDKSKKGESKFIDGKYVGVNGKFYYVDCRNCGYFCNSSASDTLEDKANLLYTYLPLIHYCESRHSGIFKRLGIIIEDRNGLNLSCLIKDFYYNMCKDMEDVLKDEGITEDFTSLIDQIFS